MNFVKSRAWLCLVIGFQVTLPARGQHVISDSQASAKLAISPANPRLLKNSPLSFSAGLAGANLTQVVKWTSSNPAVATVDTSGHAALLSPGTATISAILGSRQASTVLTVTTAVNPAFVAQPADTNVSAVIDPTGGVRVQLLDNLGGPLAGQSITLSIGLNPPGTGTLSGTLTQATDGNGTATFPDLRIDWLGQGYTLVAAATPVSGAVSAASAKFNELRVGDPCLGPNPACSSGCPDADGDGLNDAWEIAGGIDYNGDGKIDAQHDLLLPGADPHKPDIYVRYDWMDYGGTDTACTVDSDCTNYGTGHAGETCTGPAVIPTASGSCRYACATDADCTSRPRPLSHVGERCIANSCLHTHDPELEAAGAIQKVIDRFAARGFNLHVLRGQAVPHSHVLSFRANSQVDNSCEGGSIASGTAGAGKYVDSFYDLKAAGFDPKQAPAYHYAIFGHYNSCDSPGHCKACPATGKIPSPPGFGASGLAEINGNDFMVSMGNAINDRAAAPTIFNMGGTFMHELGHNLGLRHGGGSDFNGDAEDTPTFKPNFISVMNYMFQLNGIPQADTIGSIVPDPALSRLDYSTQTLPAGGNTPGALTEAGPGLNEPAGFGSGTADLTAFDDGACGFGFQPTNGPLDYDGDGNFTGTNVSVDLNRLDHPEVMGCPSGVTETLNGHTDWGPELGQSIFAYKFQCTSFAADQLQLKTSAQNQQAAGAGAFPARLLAQDELTPEVAAQAHALYPPRPVKIVVRPGCKSKAVAPGQAGVVGVAVLGEADFDVSEVEPGSLRLHGAQALSVSTRDADASGKPRLYATFDMKDLKIHANAATARLTGWLKNSQFFIGEDQIKIVPSMSLADANCH